MTWRGTILVGLAAIGVTLPLRAQGTRWDENWVGSEWEVYARALASRGLISDQPWAIRPFSASVIRDWSATATDRQPWASRDGRSTELSSMFHLVRPSVSTSYNSGFAWGSNDGPVWQGRGLNVWATAGATMHAGHFSARFEPLIEYAANQSFELIPSGVANPYVDPLRDGTIDSPQRFGNGRYEILDPGQSYVRFDYSHFGVGFSTENLFWGPGIRQAVLFDANAGGFPHAFIGSNSAIPTPIGRFAGQVIYGRLEESAFAPYSISKSRLGAGMVGVWMPPSEPIEIGFARFYHRGWPKHFGLTELEVPFGTLLGAHVEVTPDDPRPADTPDNQLLSLFGRIRVPSVGLELFGEYARNDRGNSARDVEVEPEHNAGYMLGFLQTFAAAADGHSFWTLRAEFANARIAALQQIGRLQATFYDHSPITQGHTERGQILGSILIDQSGGLDAALDKWTPHGRIGLTLMERQLPGSFQVGMPASGGRTQWDVGMSLTAFMQATDVSVQLGHVFDLNRFPGRDVGNSYLRLSVRPGDLQRR